MMARSTDIADGRAIPATGPDSPTLAFAKDGATGQWNAFHRGHFTRRMCYVIAFFSIAAGGIGLWDMMTRIPKCTPTRRTKSAVGPNGALSQGIDLFNFNVGRYPRSLDELMTISDTDPDRSKWAGPYIRDKEELQDPWGRPFRYVVPGRHNARTYDLWSAGADGVDQTLDGDGDCGDDIRNWE